HAAGIELDHAVLVGQATQPDAVVVRIVFRPGDDLHHRIQRVAAAAQHGVAAVQVVVPVVGADDDRLPGRRARRWRALVGLLGLQVERERRRTGGGGGDEVAAGEFHGSLPTESLTAKQHSTAAWLATGR